MHKKNINPNVLCLSNSDFINSLLELKDYLLFNLITLDNLNNNLKKDLINVIIFDEDIANHPEKFKKIKKKNNIDKLLISNSNLNKKVIYDDHISKPISINELNDKITKLSISQKFYVNSTIKIKDYILDKNTKKISRKKTFIIVTEKEVQLLELLVNSSKPISKKEILNSVWKYSSDTDTHTVETHVYRLRKKIIDKFKDEKFILSTKKGYIIWEKEIKLLWIFIHLNIEKELLSPKKGKAVLKEKKLKLRNSSAYFLNNFRSHVSAFD